MEESDQEKMDPSVEYFISLPAIRDNAKIVYGKAVEGKLTNFEFHQEHLAETAEFVTSVIKVSHQDRSIIPRLTTYREISAPTSSTRSLPTEDGSILKRVGSHGSPIF